MALRAAAEPSKRAQYSVWTVLVGFYCPPSVYILVLAHILPPQLIVSPFAYVCRFKPDQRMPTQAQADDEDGWARPQKHVVFRPQLPNAFFVQPVDHTTTSTRR